MSPSTDRSEHGSFASELKFLVEPRRAAEIEQWAKAHLTPDPYAGADGRYQVTSLYFDTADRLVYARKGSYGRSKYRVRRYGDGDVIFAERKMKRKDRVGKLRSQVTEAELAKLDHPLPQTGWPGYWFHRRLRARGLEPVCQIAYQRLALAQMTPRGAVRLTIDSDLHTQPVERVAFHAERGVELLDRRIVEIKFRGDMPALFQDLCRRFVLTPEPFSKYRAAAAILDLVPERALCKAS